MEKKWVVRPKVSRNIITQLLANRGLTSKKEIDEFLNPPSPNILISQYPYILGLDQKELKEAVEIIKSAIKEGKPIIIHGDYDADGICSTAILWETIYQILGYKNAHPFIPDRFTEGYGLSKGSIDKIQSQTAKLPNCQTALLITVDCGISTLDEVKYAKSVGFDVIVTDHHVKGERLPDAEAILWTDKVCGATIAWILSEELRKQTPTLYPLPSALDLVALATIADLEPLLGPNRALVKYGLLELNQTLRVGLQALIKEAGLEGKRIGPYEVGWILAPRLNATGRLENAMDSLRLLCTPDPAQAEVLARRLSKINTERQKLTNGAFNHAKESLSSKLHNLPPLLVLNHESYHEGIVGLVASRLVEEFHRPAIAIAKGEKISKGSARSISGFNVIRAIKACEDLLIDAGGHPMAAGFTIETEKIALFQEKLLSVVSHQLSENLLSPTLKIDAEVNLSDLTWKLWEALEKFEPFGIGNPRPLFLTRGIQVLNVRTVGSEGKHLKLQIRDTNHSTIQPLNHFTCIGFGFGNWSLRILPGDKINLVYTFDINEWNNQRRLQLKIKDLRMARNGF